MLATECAKHYGIKAQEKNESDAIFRARVAGKLRDMGHIIEAHEAHQDQRYEESSDVATDIVGAMAQALQGVDYGRSGERQVDDDFAAGTIVQNPKPEMTPEMALLMVELFGKS